LGVTEVTDLFDAPIHTKKAMGSHHNATTGTDVWLTPPHIIEALGPFDLDPCAASEPRPWETARNNYAIEDDGLRQKWDGRIFLNPPYSRMNIWLARLADHGRGAALIFARTETRTFQQEVWAKASGLLFLAGRLHFHHPDGKRAAANSGAPSVLVAYGIADAQILRKSSLPGTYVEPLPRN
jgi:hypothetical protein